MANLEGMQMKFIVFKIEDVEKLPHHEKVALGHIAENIEANRAAEGKNQNTYVVINTDEPYADKVINIMKENGHWG